MNNLFVSYDLKNPGQSYERVIAAIKTLGSWAKVQYSFWYVNSSSTAKQAAEIVWRAQDANDSLIVVDATNNDAAWYGLNTEVAGHIQKHWQQRAGAYRSVATMRRST